MPDAKKHSDNTKIMEQPIVPALNLKFGHFITKIILYSHLFQHSPHSVSVLIVFFCVLCSVLFGDLWIGRWGACLRLEGALFHLMLFLIGVLILVEWGFGCIG